MATVCAIKPLRTLLMPRNMTEVCRVFAKNCWPSTLAPKNSLSFELGSVRKYCSSKVNDKHSAILNSWSFQVEMFGRVEVKSSSNVTISPVDPVKYPEADRAFVSMLGNVEQRTVNKQNENTLCDVHLKGKDVLCVHGNKDDGRDIQIRIEVPIKYDIDANMSNGGQLSIAGIDNDFCQVTMDTGECQLTSIKSVKLSIVSNEGSVTSRKGLQSNGEIRVAGCGSVSVEKVYGKDIKISTQHGSITTQAVYQDQSVFSSDSGNIKLGNLHGSSHVTNRAGNITIDTLDGDLNASTVHGNISAHISRHNKVSLSSQEGDITIKVPDSTETSLELESKLLEIDEKLNVKRSECENNIMKGVLGNAGDKTLRAKTQDGGIYLQCQSWFDTLNLKKK